MGRWEDGRWETSFGPAATADSRLSQISSIPYSMHTQSMAIDKVRASKCLPVLLSCKGTSSLYTIYYYYKMTPLYN